MNKGLNFANLNEPCAVPLHVIQLIFLPSQDLSGARGRVGTEEAAARGEGY